mgnify:CR=1 FL=1
MVDWMIEVVNNYKCDENVFFLSVDLMDRYFYLVNASLEPSDLHFSNVVSMGKEDIVKVREIFIKAIAEARLIIKDSPEEKLQSICVDFFEV